MDLKPALHIPLIFFVLFLVSCGPPTPAPSPYASFTDALGRSIHLSKSVHRVVSISPNLTEIAFTAGAGPMIVGVTTADDYPPAVDSLPHFGALPIDFEAIVALRPDLVLANGNINNPRDAETFEALGIPIYFFAFESLDDMIESIRTVGALLETSAHAEAAADSLVASFAALRLRTQHVETRPLTLFLISDETLYSFGPESYIHELIDLAGGRSATDMLDAVRPVLSDEFVLIQKPDVIFGSFGTPYEVSRLLEHHPTWDIVPAVHHQRVHSLDPALLLRPTPRLLDGARLMARYLHPDLFSLPEESEAPVESR